MKRLTFVAAVAATLMAAAGAVSAEVAWTKGEVKKVDLEQGKVTVKHEEIKNLDMPPMTMVFTATDPKVLQALKPGQTAEFEFVDDKGRIVIKQVKE